MASDFHTHSVSSDSRALISSLIPLPGQFTSREFHPWNLPEQFISEKIPEFSELHKFAALGEIGLDKLHTPAYDIQIKYFNALLQRAADCSKPVVIHCVRSWQELFAALKPFKLRIMIHGFCSSPELLDELWKRKITVSFAHTAIDRPALMNKLSTAHGRFGFESDDIQISIMEILHRAQKVLKYMDVESETDQHFADFLEI